MLHSLHRLCERNQTKDNTGVPGGPHTGILCPNVPVHAIGRFCYLIPNKNWNLKMNLNISQVQICLNSQSPLPA